MGAEATDSSFARQVSTGQRFGFGRNWARFLDRLDDGRISQAQRSLAEWLETDNLYGRTFLDIGCGSGLFSLAARKLGASVHSFDYDPQSVECARTLRSRYCPHDAGEWIVEEGNVLDRNYMEALGQYDVVYAWGVLITPVTCGARLNIPRCRWRMGPPCIWPSTMTRVERRNVGGWSSAFTIAQARQDLSPPLP